MSFYLIVGIFDPVLGISLHRRLLVLLAGAGRFEGLAHNDADLKVVCGTATHPSGDELDECIFSGMGA